MGDRFEVDEAALSDLRALSPLQELTTRMIREAQRRLDERVEQGPYVGLIYCSWCKQYHTLVDMITVKPITLEFFVERRPFSKLRPIACPNKSSTYEGMWKKFTTDVLLMAYGYSERVV